VEQSGPPAAFLAGGCAGIVVAAVMWIGRGALTVQQTPEPAGLTRPATPNSQGSNSELAGL